jgi:hypothetical protein
VLDLEEYLSGQTVSIDAWNTLFAAIKAANLLVSFDESQNYTIVGILKHRSHLFGPLCHPQQCIVTISHFR